MQYREFVPGRKSICGLAAEYEGGILGSLLVTPKVTRSIAVTQGMAVKRLSRGMWLAWVTSWGEITFAIRTPEFKKGIILNRYRDLNKLIYAGLFIGSFLEVIKYGYF